jgi:type III pantothenate kinase
MNLLVEIDASGLRSVRWSPGEGACGPVLETQSPEQWPDLYAGTDAAPTRVWMLTAAGDLLGERFAAFVKNRYAVAPHIVSWSEALASGVPAWAKPLGVRRWCAAMAARHRSAGPIVLVDAAERVTIDLIDAGGQYRGGVVLPGERPMREALHTQTSGIAAAALLDDPATDGIFGINTAGAVRGGARLALAAAVDRVVETFSGTLGVRPAVLVSGSARQDLESRLTATHSDAVDLVLCGMALTLGGLR